MLDFGTIKGPSVSMARRAAGVSIETARKYDGGGKPGFDIKLVGCLHGLLFARVANWILDRITPMSYAVRMVKATLPPLTKEERVVGWLRYNARDNNFFRSVLFHYDRFGYLTPKQIEAVERTMNRR